MSKLIHHAREELKIFLTAPEEHILIYETPRITRKERSCLVTLHYTVSSPNEKQLVFFFLNKGFLFYFCIFVYL